jgi:hypothetical protein
MLCQFCEDLDLDEAAMEDGVQHHASLTDLVASAKKWPSYRGSNLNDNLQIRYRYEELEPALSWDQGSGRGMRCIAYLDICAIKDNSALLFFHYSYKAIQLSLARIRRSNFRIDIYTAYYILRSTLPIFFSSWIIGWLYARHATQIVHMKERQSF